MLETEMRNPASKHIDTMTTGEMVALMNNANREAVQAVEDARESIAAAIDAIGACLKGGGRVFYVGAGTSGRLGVVDASECPPTFGVSPELFTGVIAGGRDAMFRSAEGVEDDPVAGDIAGGRDAMFRSAEGVEDDPEAGERDLAAEGVKEGDAVVGISAAGGARYVLAALDYAASHGCVTVGITNNPGTALAQRAQYPIVLRTGAEVITGSTRLNAGTSQKLVLNMISTCTMVQTGKVRENLMINLRPMNEKLKKRMIGIVKDLCGREDGEALLEAHGWNIAQAVEAAEHEAT